MNGYFFEIFVCVLPWQKLLVKHFFNWTTMTWLRLLNDFNPTGAHDAIRTAYHKRTLFHHLPAHDRLEPCRGCSPTRPTSQHDHPGTSTQWRHVLRLPRPACSASRQPPTKASQHTYELVTQVERKNRYVRLGKLCNKQAPKLRRVSIKILKDFPSMLRRTMTTDNGKEFAEFAKIQKTLNMKVYFDNPYSPWERGANKNTNGLLRDFFPKGSDMRKVTQKDVTMVQVLLNNRPRKYLNYRTPHEVLNKLPGVALRNWIHPKSRTIQHLD